MIRNFFFSQSFLHFSRYWKYFRSIICGFRILTKATFIRFHRFVWWCRKLDQFKFGTSLKINFLRMKNRMIPYLQVTITAKSSVVPCIYWNCYGPWICRWPFFRSFVVTFVAHWENKFICHPIYCDMGPVSCFIRTMGNAAFIRPFFITFVFPRFVVATPGTWCTGDITNFVTLL